MASAAAIRVIDDSMGDNEDDRGSGVLGKPDKLGTI
jgi:hypothetical protein